MPGGGPPALATRMSTPPSTGGGLLHEGGCALGRADVGDEPLDPAPSARARHAPPRGLHPVGAPPADRHVGRPPAPAPGRSRARDRRKRRRRRHGVRICPGPRGPRLPARDCCVGRRPAGSSGPQAPRPIAEAPVQHHHDHQTEVDGDDVDGPPSPPHRRCERPHGPRRRHAERFRQYRTTGDRGLRNELIEDHRWLALHCAQRFANKGEPLDDLVQVAMLGVLKAVERYDPDFGATFATFAVPTITGELRRHFRDTTWAVHVPRRAKDLQHTVKVAVDRAGPDARPLPHRRGDRRPGRRAGRRGAGGARGRPLLPQASRSPRTGDDGEFDDAVHPRRRSTAGSTPPTPRTTVGRPARRAARPGAPHRRAALHGRAHPVADRRAGRRQPGPGVAPAAVPAWPG